MDNNCAEIHFEYKYYSKNRITPLFIGNDELLGLSYDGFYSRMLSEVPHIAKLAATPSETLRLILVEGNRSEIDLSPKYFKSQMTRQLNKGLKTIVIRVVTSESPLVAQPTTSKVAISDHPRSKRRLDLVQNNGQGNLQVQLNDNSKTVINPNTVSVPAYGGAADVILPLERHARKHEETMRNISEQLKSKTRELECFDEKLSEACQQNGGHLSACGNCHLKLGHTRKSCSFSPCRTAFSCGIIVKHNDQKSTRASLTKEVSKLETGLTKARTDMESAKTALKNVNNSSKKIIEDILINEQPNRYITGGRRNWLALNKDVMLLQSKLKGSLPTRTNVMNLLNSLVRETSQSTSTKTRVSTVVSHDTDHRMAPQKRVLVEEFGINFPTKKLCSESTQSSKSHLCLDGQDKIDFHMALKLQQEEIENSSSDFALNDACTNVFDEDDNEDLQLEADAAAALLHLKARK